MKTYDEVLTKIKLLAEILNNKEKGQTLIENLTNSVATIKSKLPSQSKSIVILHSTARDVTVELESSIAGCIALTLGLKNLANKLNVSKYIDFLGFVDNIQSYYKYCDIFTLPSKNEGFGIVYLEAMQYKKQVIAVNYGGPTDVIINEESGYLCEFEDEKCLAEKINLLFKNKELSKELGENGYRRLMDNFTYRHFKNNLRGILI